MTASRRRLAVGEIRPLVQERYRIGGKTGEYVIDWRRRHCSCPARSPCGCWHLRALAQYLEEREAPCPACRGRGWLVFPSVCWFVAPGRLIGPTACVACEGSGRREDVPEDLLARLERRAA